MLKKCHSKTSADLYKTASSTKQKFQKSIKADSKLHRLVSAASSGRPVDMANILEHQLLFLSLAKPGRVMNSRSKTKLISILTAGVSIPSEGPAADLKTRELIDGHAIIQALGKPQSCLIFGDYANVFIQAVKCHYGEHTNRADVRFDCWSGEGSVKAVTLSKRLGNPSEN